MAKRTCSVDGCDAPHYARGWCNKHYLRWWTTGTVERPPKPTVCVVPDCDGPAKTRGYCGMHYARLRRYGDVNVVRQIRGDSEARFWSYVEKGDGCWRWTGQHNASGYASMVLDGNSNASAFRFAYELLIGPIAEGLVLDHLCRNRWCVNPAHGEPVTNQENVLRGIGPTAVNARKTECIHGHPFNVENTGLKANGNRFCKTCVADYQRRRRARRRATEARA